MANLTIRNIDERVKTGLRMQAARKGLSMEQQAREILQRAVLLDEDSAPFAQRIQRRFAGLLADELPIPARQRVRTPPDWRGK